MSAIFSIIIPTRNRPALLARAVASVRAQSRAALEIIVVDDGSEAPFHGDLATIEQSLGGIGRFIRLAPRSIGHGQSYALNVGAASACGDYLCFLDDDDYWIDPGHLARTRGIIEASPQSPDVIYFEQRARLTDGRILPGPIWIEDLRPILARERRAGAHGAYTVDIALLMRSGNFCHLNTSVVRRDFYTRIGGLYEDIRYENDRDFYLRCIDHAELILYAPFVVAEHSAPDPTRQLNMSTIFSQRDKWLAQLIVFNRAALSARDPRIRHFGRLQRGYTKKKMALSLLEDGQYDEAFGFALDGLASSFSLKWLGMTLLIGARATVARMLRSLRYRPS